jgi:hypothetical protein
MRGYTRLPIRLAAFIAAIGAVAPASATTLQQLTLDDMIQKSTSIVRARVIGSRSAYHGAGIYTYFQIQVLETWKSSGPAAIEVAIPGGVANGIRQSVAGSPALKPGEDYVLFLWAGPSGLTQVIGLSQGVFKLSEGGSGEVVAQRPAASELMLDASGLAVEDRPVRMQLPDLRTRVLQAQKAAK